MPSCLQMDELATCFLAYRCRRAHRALLQPQAHDVTSHVVLPHGVDTNEGVEKKAQNESHWLGVAGGFLSARHAPTNLAELESWGATAVVTLLHEGERGIEVLRQGAEELGLKWELAPVQPIANASRRVSAQDVESLRRASCALELLRQGERVAVHCRAGFHRTGTFCYILLRQSGKNPAEAMEALRAMRELTWLEMEMRTRKRPQGLHVKAEQIFKDLDAPLCIRAG